MGNNPQDCASIGLIDSGDGYSMKITGYKRYLPYRVLSVIGYVLTLGALRLLYHWFPVLMLHCTHRKCDLSEATKILARDTFDDKYKSYYIEDVVKTQIAEEPKSVLRISTLGKPEVPKIRVNVDDGNEFELSEIRIVKIKRLTYVWVPQRGEFSKLSGLNNAKKKSELHDCKGMTKQEQQNMQVAYGKNDTSVPMPTIYALIVLEVLNPFYFFQVFSIIVWLLDAYYYYCIAVVLMSIFGISTSVIETYKNEKSLHDLMNKIEVVTVRRGTDFYETIQTTELVPGDIIVVPQHGCSLLCDAIILDGSCVVDESMLTGESLPVSKTSLGRTDDLYNVADDARHTLFSGTRVIQTRTGPRVHAIVINTGFLTTKGGLVRSILYPPPADYAFDNDSYKFIWILAAIGVAGMIYTCILKWDDESGFDLLLDSLELLTTTIPPALPATMAIGKIYALSRLKKKHIACINSRVINVSGSIDFVCFDKTGTLTQDGFNISKVIPIEEQLIKNPVDDVKNVPFSHLLYGMATCHSLSLINGKLEGDPMEAKMFEWTSWDIQEEQSFSLVFPKNNLFEAGHKLRIRHQFQFLSKLQRMSVIVNKVKEPNQLLVYCKGSPEMIASLSTPESVPPDYTDILKTYTSKGFRVIAIGWRYLNEAPINKLDSLRREDVEKDLTLCGLLIFENKLKPQTKSTINELKGANLSPVMITGDNLQTAVCVARECGIMMKCDNGSSSFQENVLESENDWDKFMARHHFQSGDILSSYCQLAMTGTVWNKIKSEYPLRLSEIVTKTPVLARMSSEQKKEVILELQKVGYTVAMCGDGANDCSALKAANVGISLSQAEASVASPFTYREENISCVPTVIKEGRAALATSFGIFKFMVLYSYTEFFSTIFLYYDDSNLTDLQFLIIDCGIIVISACFFGQTKAYKNDLVDEPLPPRILSTVPLLSMLFQAIIASIAQIISYKVVHLFPWFVPFQFINREDFASYENYAVYTVSQFQYITFAVVFSIGPPFRERMYTNRLFTLAMILMTLVCLYITVYPAEWMINAIQFRFPPNETFPAIVVGISFVYSVCSIFLEDFIVNYVFAKKLKWR